MSPSSPLRVLHVLGGLGLGGVETWLMHVLRRIDRTRFQMDFLVHVEEPQPYDAEALSLGAQILRCRWPANPWTYAHKLSNILDRERYDVVHSHVHHFSGFVLWLAKRAGVPVRIGHSHNDTRSAERGSSLHRQAYLLGSRTLLSRSATVGLAASRLAAEDLFGPAWELDPRVRILYCGLDLSPFAAMPSGKFGRSEFGFGEDALVVGNVSNFSPPKNHAFFLRVLAEMSAREPRVRGLLVGDGPLRGEIERQIEALGLRERVLLTGARRDVPRLLAGVMDAFLFPSLHEGLPLALLEAQAAGLPCVASDRVTHEVAQSKSVEFLPLSAPLSAWAERTLAGAREGRRAAPDTRRWPSDLSTSLPALEAVYSSRCAGRKGGAS